MKTFLFLGSRRGYAALKKFLQLKASICGIFCLKEDPHEEQYHEKISALAKENNIPIYFAPNLKPTEYSEILKKCEAEIAFVIGWRFLIPKEAYTLPIKGTLIIHDSLLPKYRGFSPMSWAIINGEKETGVTLFFIAETVDSGAIVDQLKTPIYLEDTVFSLDQRLIQLYEKIIEKNFTALQSGNFTTRIQNEDEATFCCKRIPEDGLINWNQPAIKIYNFIRALSQPLPGAFTYLKGKKIFIWRASLPKTQLNYVGAIPGRVIGKINEKIQVVTENNIICIEEVSIENTNKIMPAKEMIISVKDTFR